MRANDRSGDAGRRPGPSAAGEFWAGARGLSTLLVSVAPFGLIYGVLAVGGGFALPWLAQLW